MKTHRQVGLPLLLLVLGVARSVAQAELKPWQTLEVTLQCEKPLERPYMESLPGGSEALARVTFEGTAGEALGQRYAMDAFWDGGRTFKARFAPPRPGQWAYRSRSSQAALDGVTGTFTCTAWTEAEKAENPTRRGLVRVCRSGARPGRYFEYTDGTPFLWIGDTWWNWTKRGIRLSSFQKLADDRAEKGFTLGQLFFAGHGWGSPSSLLDRSCEAPDLEHVREIEAMIRYANSKGLTVWIHPWWGGGNLDRQIGAENMRRWWRYVVARLSAYNVVWTLAGEYNLNKYGGLGLSFWNELGALVDESDPYDRLLSVHPTPPGWSGGQEAPQWSTSTALHDQPWLNYNQSQVGHGRWRNEMIPLVVAADYARLPAKPIVVTEPWYEFVEGNPPAADIRFGALSAILSGAAGHSYAGGHVWKAHVPEAPAGQDSWPMETSFERNTLDYPGARFMGSLGRFLKTLPWWTLTPHPEMVSDYPAPFCAAVPGQEYLVYLRWNGSLRLDLRPSNTDDRFAVTWIDLATFQAGRPKTVPGGEVRELQCPKNYPGVPDVSDWLLHVVKR
jgi:hypothetical protein